MKIEDHLRNIRESLDVISESIQKGVEERQRSIGFHTSVSSVEMLEVFLHKENLLNPGAMLKHEWFSSVRKAKEKLTFDFKNKEKIISILNEIETKRNLLCYGKQQPLKFIEDILSDFNKIKSLFEEEGLKWN